MRRGIRIRILAIGVVLLGTLSGCDDRDRLDAGTPEAFVAGCVGYATRVAALLNAASAQGGVEPGMVAGFLRAYAVPPVPKVLTRDFDAKQPIPVVGYEYTADADPRGACAAVADQAGRFADVTSGEAMMLGMSRIIAAVGDQVKVAQAVIKEIQRGEASAKDEARRLRQAMDQNAPRGVSFRVMRRDQRLVPSVVIDAANVVQQPITAFVLVIRLVDAEAKSIGEGHIRFAPPVPLGPQPPSPD